MCSIRWQGLVVADVEGDELIGCSIIDAMNRATGQMIIQINTKDAKVAPL